jgi:hypothetical protein
MTTLLDHDDAVEFSPDPRESHHTITLGTAVYVPYFPLGARKIKMQVDTKDLRYTLDGTTPSATVGFHLAAAAEPIIIEVNEKVKLQVIREESGTILQYEIGE